MMVPATRSQVRLDQDAEENKETKFHLNKVSSLS